MLWQEVERNTVQLAFAVGRNFIRKDNMPVIVGPHVTMNPYTARVALAADDNNGQMASRKTYFAERKKCCLLVEIASIVCIQLKNVFVVA